MQRHRGRKAFSIIESVVALGCVSILFFAVIAMFNLIRVQKNTEYRAQAEQLLSEEVEALRSASFSSLENRTATPFIEVAYNNGDWRVDTPANPSNVPNVLFVDGVTGTNNPSRIVVPTGPVTTGTFETNFRVRDTTPSGWKINIFVRYHDDQNNYAFRITESQISIVKTLEGFETTPWSSNTSVSTNTWHSVQIILFAGAFTPYFNGTPLASFVDDTFASGHIVLGVADGAQAEFDSVQFAGDTTLSWNFDSADELLGERPLGWNRVSPSNLANGATAITITDAELEFTDLKRVALTVSWTERGRTQTLSNTFDINSISVAP